jgi:hypothetical protein
MSAPVGGGHHCALDGIISVPDPTRQRGWKADGAMRAKRDPQRPDGED